MEDSSTKLASDNISNTNTNNISHTNTNINSEILNRSMLLEML